MVYTFFLAVRAAKMQAVIWIAVCSLFQLSQVVVHFFFRVSGIHHPWLAIWIDMCAARMHLELGPLVL